MLSISLSLLISALRPVISAFKAFNSSIFTSKSLFFSSSLSSPAILSCVSVFSSKKSAVFVYSALISFKEEDFKNTEDLLRPILLMLAPRLIGDSHLDLPPIQ